MFFSVIRTVIFRKTSPTFTTFEHLGKPIPRLSPRVSQLTPDNLYYGKGGTRSREYFEDSDKMKIHWGMQRLYSHPAPDPQYNPLKYGLRYERLNFTTHWRRTAGTPKAVMRGMQQKFHQKWIAELDPWIEWADFIIEVRDARIPFASENKRLTSMIRSKPRIVVFNKCELADPAMERPILAYYARHGVPAIFVSAKLRYNISDLLHLIQRLPVPARDTRPLVGLVVGMPAVGKSTLTDRLRYQGRIAESRATLIQYGRTRWKHARLATGKPGTKFRIGHKGGGMTKMTEGALISYEPPITLYDTPAVSYPALHYTEEVGLKMVCCGMIRVGRKVGMPAMIAVSYLLQHIMNTPSARRAFLAHLHITEAEVPTYASTPMAALRRLCFVIEDYAKYGFRHRSVESQMNFDRAALYVLSQFHRGAFGPMTLDRLPYDLDDTTHDVVGVDNPTVTPDRWLAHQSLAFRAESVFSRGRDVPHVDPRVGALPRHVREYGHWLNRDIGRDEGRPLADWLTPGGKWHKHAPKRLELRPEFAECMAAGGPGGGGAWEGYAVASGGRRWHHTSREVLAAVAGGPPVRTRPPPASQD